MKYSKTVTLLSALSLLILSAPCLAGQEAHNDPPPRREVTITAVGDIMPGTGYPTTDYLPPDNGVSLFKNVAPYLKSADITFGNLEGALLDEGETVKGCLDPKRCFAFRIPESYVDLLTGAGFDLLSLANNHISDFGVPGKERTVAVLKEAGIHFAGLTTHPWTVFEKSGITYGFCAFAPNKGTVSLLDLEEARRIVRHLETVSDITIVSFHGGAEGYANRHVTGETEMFLGEDRGNIGEFAHSVIDWGADLVFGHGPHVTRAVELYRNRFVAYSLGNFCTYKRFNLLGPNGIAPILNITTDGEGRFLSGTIIPVRQEHLKGPRPDPDRAAIREIIELSRSDFPDSPLIIEPDGSIVKKEEE